MAVLSDQDRATVWAEYMRAQEGAHALTKADLRAAVDALDAWVDTNAAALNQAIPQPARAALTTKQKAKLFMYVVGQRYRVEP